MHLPGPSLNAVAGLWAFLAASSLASVSSYEDLARDTGSVAAQIHNHPVLAPGRLARISNATVASNSSLAKALEIAAASQQESQERNARLLASPRKNEYTLHHDRSRPSDLLEDGGTVSRPVSDGTGVNATVAAALSLVAEASAKNNSIVIGTGTGKDNLKLNKRGGGYWMQNMVQNGASPYAPGDYKVHTLHDRRALGL